MMTLQRIWRPLNVGMIWFLRLLLVSVLIILLYVVVGQTLGAIPINQDYQPAAEGIEIFVISNGIHTDFVLPVVTEQLDWRTYVNTAEFAPGADEAPMVAFGWGEKGLYDNVPTWGDLRARHVVHAMLIPTQSTMHITFYPAKPIEGPLVKQITISEEQYALLSDFIIESFRTDENGQFINMWCCWYSDINDNFYESPPTYHAFHTCNNWTGKGLKIIGLPTGLWTPFHTDILNHLDSIED